MATFQVATASRGARVTDTQAVRPLCEAHCFGMLDWEVTDTDEFSIWGYDTFDVYEADDEDLPDYDAGIAMRPFLRELSAYIAPDAELDIQTAGYTKCRFPVYAQRYVVREDEVLDGAPIKWFQLATDSPLGHQSRMHKSEAKPGS